MKRKKYSYSTAVNGLEAVNIFKATPVPFDFVLMDITMPVMDGFEATQQLRARGFILPILALTANVPGEVKDRAWQAGMNDILLKPFLPDELYKTVLHYVQEAGAGR